MTCFQPLPCRSALLVNPVPSVSALFLLPSAYCPSGGAKKRKKRGGERSRRKKHAAEQRQHKQERRDEEAHAEREGGAGAVGLFSFINTQLGEYGVGGGGGRG